MMTWVKIDDQFPNHPKLLAAGPLAMLLNICALCYAGQYLTDGFIPHAAVAKLVNLNGISEATGGVPGMFECMDEPDAYVLAARLVAVNLWEEVPGGYQIHDYLEYNPSRAEVKAKQNEWRESGRRGGLKTQAQARNKGILKGSLERNASEASSEIQAPSPTPTHDTQSANADCDAASAAPPAPTETRIGSLPEPQPQKPTRRTRQADPPPPAVQIYREVARRYPDKSLFEAIDRAVGRDPSALDHWRNIVTHWIACGWSKINLDGMLDYFQRNEIPSTRRLDHGSPQRNNPAHQGQRGTKSAEPASTVTSEMRRLLSTIGQRGPVVGTGADSPSPAAGEAASGGVCQPRAPGPGGDG
jgi:hypothetical protein